MSRKPQDNKPAQLNANEQRAVDEANKVNDIVPDEFKKQLRIECRTYKKLLEQEEQMINYYQLEREKINYNWIILNKELEDEKSKLINKNRELEDQEENHTMTLNLYKQKIKHLQFQNQDQQSQLKKEVEMTLKQLEDEHRIKERELKTDNRNLQVQLKEQELCHYDYMYSLQLEADKQMTELRQDYERRYTDVKKKYDLKMQKLRQEMEEARITLTKQVEESKEAKIQQITQEHAKKYLEIKNYYADITATNLDKIKTNTQDINTKQSIVDNDRKLIMRKELECRGLSEPLKKVKEEIQRLIEKKEDHLKIKEERKQVKRAIDQSEKLYRKMEYEHEVRLQQYEYLKRDKQKLHNQFSQAIQTIQQKLGLKNLIYEKQIQGISENIEAKDVEIYEVLKNGSNIEKSQLENMTKSLDEVENVRNDVIMELEKQLLQIRKAHSHMVKAYEGKLSEFVIPVEELGFDPLVPTNID